jgi:cysteinyl-tRNA synthetase
MNDAPASGAGGWVLVSFDGMTMELKLYDTLTREKRAFVPIDPRNVRMYVCGPTVYDFAHIGNARPVIVFDVLFRLLRHLYGAEHVTYVRNVTDVDDKINARAAERGIPIRELTEETYANFKEDVKKLGSLAPTEEPRATEYIRRTDGLLDMITLIERLIANGHAYVAEGHVLFHVPSMPEYGKLSKRSLDEMIAGARVEVAPYKKNPMDFVLWKPSNPSEPGWDSPWGRGRPGWHIECSAMSGALLGETFDIHGGGIDLVFPHHENEIAQSRCAFHTSVMANYWMHNGFLQVEGEKMSKSLGNFVTIRELLNSTKFGGKEWDGNVLRAAMLQTHYRQPIDWTVRSLEQTEVRLERWMDFAAQRTVKRRNLVLMNSFIQAIADDLNAPDAFSLLDRAINSETATDEDRYTVFEIIELMGFETGKKTRVASVAARLQYLRNTLGSFSERDWKKLSAAVVDHLYFENGDIGPEGTFLASMTALVEVSRTIETKMQPSLLQSFFEFYLDKLLQEENRRVKARNDFLAIAKRVQYILNALSKFTLNDWNTFSNTASNSLTSKRARLKPETKLLAYMRDLIIFWHTIEQKMPENARTPQLEMLKEQIKKGALSTERKSDAKVRRLISERNDARRAKDFAKSDHIRDQLRAMGVVLKDSKDGTTTWERVR